MILSAVELGFIHLSLCCKRGLSPSNNGEASLGCYLSVCVLWWCCC